MQSNFLIEKDGKTYCIRPECDNSCKNYSRCKIIQTLYKKEESEQDITFKYSVSQITIKKQDLPKVKKSILIDKDKFSKLRGIGKIVGLALTYGCSAYTIMNNTGLSLEDSERKKNNFFSALTQVRKTMLLSEQRTLTTGKVQNFFGRICDVSRWAFSKAQTEKERRQDKGYAVRIGYNYPIQSSMTELLKIAMIRIDETIYNNKWNPLYGTQILQNIHPYSYTDILCTTLLSIHDELDFLLRTDSFDSLIPEIYKVLQVTDIVKSLGVDFLLEMDVEYDLTRSFTATTKYPSAKIHLFNSVLPNVDKEINSVPNMLLVDFEKINKETLKKLLNFFEVSGNIYIEGDFYVGIQNKGEVYVMPRKITESGLKEILKVTGGRKACYQG